MVNRETDTKPLILTLWIEDEAQSYFNALRKRYFPPEKNFIDAHITLFHALPDSANIIADIMAAAAMQHNFSMEAKDIIPLGYGTAIRLEGVELFEFQRQLQKKWQDELTNQDRQALRPHVTVQNKVTVSEAKNLQLRLSAEFKPFYFRVTGVKLWRYLDGPWEFRGAYAFNRINGQVYTASPVC